MRRAKDGAINLPNSENFLITKIESNFPFKALSLSLGFESTKKISTNTNTHIR